MSVILTPAFSKSRSAILLACGFFSISASATSSKIHNYSLSECAKSFCVSAQGSEAFMSLVSPTVAAENVQLRLSHTHGAEENYVCKSMAYLLESSLLTCEQAKPGKTVVVDFATSEISRF
jgi:hypothetical protein